MIRLFGASIGVLLLLPAQSFGHRTDEYLQAARISLARDRATLELDLTPGISLAPAVVPLLDRDGDRAISPAEAEGYGRIVLADLELELDGRSTLLTLDRVEAPLVAEMFEGLGTIRISASASVHSSGTGRHRLHFRNNHQPVPSVFMVNALAPEDADVEIAAQTRDARQQSVHIDYTLRPPQSGRVLWLPFGAAGLTTWWYWRRRRWEDGSVNSQPPTPNSQTEPIETSV